MTPNNSTGILESFQRFAQLSTFWQRANTPADLVAREQQEYLRLLGDIPCQIQRLIAFADLGTTKMIEAHAEAGKGPDTEWRMLAIGERRQPGDQFEYLPGDWLDLPACAIMDEIDENHYPHRRRLATPAQSGVGGIVSTDTEKARESSASGQKLPIPSEDVEPPCVCEPPRSEPAYRMLKVGEVIQDGDQYQHSPNIWLRTSMSGYELDGVQFRCPYRRPIQ